MTPQRFLVVGRATTLREVVRGAAGLAGGALAGAGALAGVAPRGGVAARAGAGRGGMSFGGGVFSRAGGAEARRVVCARPRGAAGLAGAGGGGGGGGASNSGALVIAFLRAETGIWNSSARRPRSRRMISPCA